MFTNLTRTTKLFGAIIAVVLIMTIIMMSINGNKVPPQPNVHYINDNASADNKVEALKTMTADLLAVEHKNKQLQQNIENLKFQNTKSMSHLEQSMSKRMQQAIQKIQIQNQQKQQALFDAFKQKETTQRRNYPVNNDDNQNEAFVWVADLSKPITHHINTKRRHSLFSISNNNDTQSLLHGSDDGIHHQKNKDLMKPVYTIPVNATLTGATLMTPLVGRVPIDGKLTSPYHFKLVLSANNLTANGYPMPGVKGAVMSGVASGDMLGRCARGTIHSMTFIFNDGVISTTQAKGQNNSLGYLSSQTGNPCIVGTFHSNAAIFLGAQMGLAGVKGYANAITHSQYMNSTTSEGTSIQTLIGNANKAAFGQSGSAAAEAAQTWWNQRVQNSFDYVYVPNVDSKTGKPMKVVVNITQQIPINFDTNAREVSYENSLQNNNNQLD